MEIYWTEDELKPSSEFKILIAVKTTKKYHETRVKDILETWFQFANNKVCSSIIITITISTTISNLAVIPLSPFSRYSSSLGMEIQLDLERHSHFSFNFSLN